MKILAAIISGIALSAFVALPAFAATGTNEAEQSLHESTMNGNVPMNDTAQYNNQNSKKSMNGTYAEARRSLNESRQNGIH